MTDARTRRTEAKVQRSAWPGWIWSVPIAAIGVAGWFGIQALIHGGDTVTITFDDAYGMKAGGTDVTLHGVKIRTVSNVTLAADGRHVEVQATIDRTRKDDLRSGTRFYVRGAQPDFSDLSSIKAIISGPEIVLEPGPANPCAVSLEAIVALLLRRRTSRS